MKTRRKIVRRSFLTAVTGTSALMMAGCGAESDAGGNNSAAGDTRGGNAAAAPAEPATDADQ